MIKIFSVGISLLILTAFAGCVSGKDWKYAQSPYATYLDGYYSPDDESAQRITRLVYKSKSNPPHTFWLHWQIAKWSYENKHYGTALYAMNELNTYYPQISQEHFYIIFNIGVLMDKLKLRDAAKGRFEYVLAKSNNMILNNRCTAILIKYDAREDVSEDYYVYDFS